MAEDNFGTYQYIYTGQSPGKACICLHQIRSSDMFHINIHVQYAWITFVCQYYMLGLS